MVRQLCGCFVVLWVVLLTASAHAQEKTVHPRLRAALFELREARRELQNAREEFHGHREKAHKAVEEAIVTLKLLLNIEGDNYPKLNREPDFYKHYHDHPRLRQALRDLREAHEELRKAGGDFHGLKERGLRDIHRAIEEIELALDERHH